MLKKTSCACPVCAAENSLFVLRSDADIYRCPKCSHVFSDPATITDAEQYGPDYYESAHKNWFDHPNIKLFSWIHLALPGTLTSLLDVGCGKGAFLKYSKGKVPTLQRVVGIDYSPNEPVPGIEFLTGDASNMPGDEMFDAVASLAVIEHVPDPVGFARVLAARCKKGGFVVVMTVNNGSLLYRMARIMYRLRMKTSASRLYSSHHLQHFTIQSLRSTLERAGLEIIATRIHNSPLAAVDIPSGNVVKRTVFTMGLIGLSFLGAVTGTAYLQTVVARRRLDDHGRAFVSLNVFAGDDARNE